MLMILDCSPENLTCVCRCVGMLVMLDWLPENLTCVWCVGMLMMLAWSPENLTCVDKVAVQARAVLKHNRDIEQKRMRRMPH